MTSTKATLWGLGFGVCLVLDQMIFQKFLLNDGNWLVSVSHVVTDLALGVYWFTISLSLFFVFTIGKRITRSEEIHNQLIEARNWASHFFLALCSTGLVVVTLKFIVGRARPSTMNPYGALPFLNQPFNWSYLYQSFPSGHSQVIFCVATLLCVIWPKQKPIFLVLASLIAITRVFSLMHFLSDVYVGMFIGKYGSQLSLDFWSRWVKLPFSKNSRHAP